MTQLINKGQFILASKHFTNLKIDADALSSDDLVHAADLMRIMLPHHYGLVIGVPTGGLELARAFSRFSHKQSPNILLVDDVWTTGGSMMRYADTLKPSDGTVMGAVLFARGETPDWVKYLFRLNDHWDLKDNDA